MNHVFFSSDGHQGHESSIVSNDRHRGHESDIFQVMDIKDMNHVFFK